MTSLRHIALGCCVLSALAGILRLFWPENGFKSVINAVLVLYILTVGVQLVHGLDWDGLVRELRSLPDGQDTADYSDYSRELAPYPGIVMLNQRGYPVIGEYMLQIASDHILRGELEIRRRIKLELV